MKKTSEEIVLSLCASIADIDKNCEQAVLNRLPEALGDFRPLAAQIAGAQRKPVPRVNVKSLAIVVDKDSPVQARSMVERPTLAPNAIVNAIALQYGIHWTIVNTGGRGPVREASPLLQVSSGASHNGGPMRWDHIRKGIRLACHVKGQQTDLMGLAFWDGDVAREAGEEISPHCDEESILMAAGFLLGAADLQTPVVLAGQMPIRAARIAFTMAPSVKNYMVYAQCSEDNPVGGCNPLLRLTAPGWLAVAIGMALCQTATNLEIG